MNSNSTTSNFLYSFNYDYHNSDLCKLEARQIFQLEEKDKVLFSDKKVDPSISPFLRHRIEIITSSPDYRELIDQIKEQGIKKEGFKVEYILFEGDESDFDERRLKMRDVGYNITGVPDFEKPTLTYAICKHDNRWYFGVLAKHDIAWHEHKKKPNSFSNSIGMDIAKALITIASKGDNTNKLLDACCGVGTVLLEGRISGFNINGNDINPKRRKQSAGNLAHYNYDGEVFCSDIADLGGNMMQ